MNGVIPPLPSYALTEWINKTLPFLQKEDIDKINGMSSVYEHRCIQLFEGKLPTAERGSSLIAVQQWMSSALCVNTGLNTSENVASSVVFEKCDTLATI